MTGPDTPDSKQGVDGGPAKSIVDPHPHDVLCGRGGQSNNHPGNEWFRRLVRSNRALYRSCPKHTKLLVAKAIVQAVRQQDPPGRFVKMVAKDEWEPIAYSQAVSKTSQALREKDFRETSRNKGTKSLEQPPPATTTTTTTNNNNPVPVQKHLEIAHEAAHRVKVDGVQTPENLANLTNVAIQSAAGLMEEEGSPSSKSKPQTTGRNKQPRKKMTMREQVQLQAKLLAVGHSPKRPQENNNAAASPGGGKKRKIATFFAKQSWWNMGSPLNRSSSSNSTFSSTFAMAQGGTIVTPGDARPVGIDGTNHFGGKDPSSGNHKRRKFPSHQQNKILGDRQSNENANNNAAMPSSPIDPTPIPLETTLGSRQSTLFRFLNTTGMFRKETASTELEALDFAHDPSEATAADSTNSQSLDVGANIDIDPTPFPYPERPPQNTMQSITSWQAPAAPSHPPAEHMGRMSVQQLRREQQQKEQQQQQSVLGTGLQDGNSEIQKHHNNNDDDNNDNYSVVDNGTGLEEELEEIPTSGLMIMNDRPIDDDRVNSTALPPPPKGLKAEVSDWLTSFFPSPSKAVGAPDIGTRNFNTKNHTTNSNTGSFGPPSFSLNNNNNNFEYDDEPTVMPPPPGGGAGLGRAVSSTIFGLVESPSLLLTTLKSGMSSMFGAFPPVAAPRSPSIRRFPSAFDQQQQQQQQQEQTGLRHFGGVTGGDNTTVIGNHSVLGQRAQRQGSLLDDVEETPMEKELRKMSNESSNKLGEHTRC